MKRVEAVPSTVDLVRQLRHDGRVWLRGAVEAEERAALLRLCEGEDRPGNRVSAGTPLFEAVRNATFSQTIARAWPGARPVRLVSFGKGATDGPQWTLPWHQDWMIAVAKREPVCTNWTRKGGQWHCEPPVETLRAMLFVRVHHDDSTIENGTMEIAPGSHHGIVPGDRVDAMVAACGTEATVAAADDVLILPMLTLHRSLPSRTRGLRRVLRIDYATGGPPAPLRWAA